MGKNSTKLNSFKVIQGGKAEVVKSTKALTGKKSIKEFLAKFRRPSWSTKQVK